MFIHEVSANIEILNKRLKIGDVSTIYAFELRIQAGSVSQKGEFFKLLI